VKLVSIIIPCFNYGAFLAEAIESALAQTYRKVEILVMDDGSPDDTPDIARTFNSRIQYIRTPNQGHGATLNDALQRICGTYYICLDADNSLSPNYVDKTLSLMESAGPETGYIYTQRELFGLRTGISASPAYDLKRLKVRNYIDTCSLIRTDLGRRYGYDTRLLQGDYDFYLTLAQNGYGGILLNEPLFRYRTHHSSMTNSLSSQYRQVEAQLEILHKHAGFYSAAESAMSIREARNRIVLAVIGNRLPGHSLSCRWKDFVAILRGHAPISQVWNQLRYLASPTGEK